MTKHTIFDTKDLKDACSGLTDEKKISFFDAETMYRLPDLIRGVDFSGEHDITIINRLLSAQQQRIFLENIKNYKILQSQQNENNKPKLPTIRNYNKLIHNFEDLEKIYQSFDQSNRELFINVFRSNIEYITKDINDIERAGVYLQVEEVDILRSDIYNREWKKMHLGNTFSDNIKLLSEQEKTHFFRYFQSKLISNEFSTIFNAIKNSNKISRNTYRTVKPETKDCGNTDLIKNVTTFFTKLSTNPNSVEAHAWRIYIEHSENINTNNQELRKAIHKSSREVSFMGISHAKKHNTLFSLAPKNSRRSKIYESIQQSSARSNDSSTSSVDNNMKKFEVSFPKPG